MPSSVAQLFEAAGLASAGAVRWRCPVPLHQPGVYIVALTNPQVALDTYPHCSISPAAVQGLLDARPELRLDGARPTRDALADRIASMWLSDETILYVGLAGTSVAHRVDQYYRTPLGARSPHAGGWPLKTLSDIDQLWVHFAPCATVDLAEATMLKTFVANVSDFARASVCDPAVPLPFANLAIPGGARKKHGITGVREPRKVGTTAQSSAVPTPPSTPR